ncbi:MAG: hypothetical protein RLZZ136_85 [Pseudomonadota bacterium]|jgi:hypothetical protein
MRLLTLVPLVFGLISAPAMAERLQFDHRLSPPLKAVLDSGREDLVHFDASNPKYVVDQIVVRGSSITDWTALFEIIARSPKRDMMTAVDWMAELRARADSLCPNTITVIAQDDHSITFQRQSRACPAERAETALYRIVAGKRSLFLLAALEKGPMDGATQQQWLAVLQSAHLD